MGGRSVGGAVGWTVGAGVSVGDDEGVRVLEGVGVEAGMSVNVGEGGGAGVGGTAVAEEMVAVGAGVGPVAQPAHANSTHRPAPTALSRWIVICGNGPD